MRHSILSVALLLFLCSSFVFGDGFLGTPAQNDQLFHGCSCPGVETLFGATLTVEDEIPRPNVTVTSVSGSALFRVLKNESDDSLFLYFELFARAPNITAAHIHVGLRCVAGPVVVFLAGGTGVSLTNASDPILFRSGNITAANFVGPLANSSIDDLLIEIENGNAYVNVHTTEQPSGIMRGQIQPVASESLTMTNLSATLECAASSSSTFLTLLAGSGLVSNETEANVTIFAPSEFAFDVFGRAELEAASQDQIDEIILAHVIEGVFSYTDFLGKVTNFTALDGVTVLVVNGTIPASEGGNRDLNLTSSRSLKVTVNDALITDPDMIVANDAIVQGIQLVLTPNTTNTTNTTSTGTTSSTTGTTGAETTTGGVASTGAATTGGTTNSTTTGGTATGGATGIGSGGSATKKKTRHHNRR